MHVTTMLEFLGFASCLAFVGEALMAALGFSLRRWGAPDGTERPWRVDGLVLGAFAALAAWPLGAPRGPVLLTGAASATILYVPLRRLHDSWARGRVVASVLAIAAVLFAAGGFVRALFIPAVGQHVGGALVGLWVVFTVTQVGPGKRLRARLTAPAARRWLDSLPRLLVLGAALGVLAAFALWHRHVPLPSTLCAPATGLIVAPVLVMLAHNQYRTTVLALMPHRGIPTSRGVARLARVVPGAGGIGAAAGAVAMDAPWRWVGVEALAIAVLITSLRSRRARDARHAPRRPRAAGNDAAVPEDWHRRRWATLAVIAGVTTLLSMEHTVLNVSLPTLQAKLGASSSELTWVVTAFLLAYAGLLLPAGSLGDRFGRQYALRAGLAVFGASSLACGFAPSAGWLIGGRSAMGVGAAAMLPTTLSTIQAVFPREKRVLAMSLWSASYALGIALGPTIGGIVVEHFGWPWIFWGLGPIAVLLLAATRLVPNSIDCNGTPLDLPGAALSAAGVLSVLWGVIEAPSRGWSDHVIVAAFGAGAALLTVFFAWELSARHPMLDLKLLRDRRFSAPAGALSLVFFALVGALFLLTIYLQVVLGYSPVDAGVRTLPVAGALIVVTLPAGRLAERWRHGPRLTITAGLSLIAVAMFYMATSTSASGYRVTLIALVIAGLGIGITQAPATTMLMSAVPSDRAGVGSGLNDTTRLTGGAFGVAVLSSVLASVYRARMSSAVASLPARLAGTAGDRIEGALMIAARIGGIPGRELRTSAVAAHITGLDAAFRVAGSAAAASAVAALLFVPALARGDRARHLGGPGPDVPAKPRQDNTERSPMYDATQPQWPSHHVLTDEGELVVYDTGARNDGGGTVVLLGGLGPTLYETWHRIVGELAIQYRVVGVDNFGHGAGRRGLPPRGSRGALDQTAADVVAVLKALDIETASVVGHSAGGAIAQLIAHDHPALVERLVFVGSAKLFDDPTLRRLASLPPWLVRWQAPAIFRKRGLRYGERQRADWHRNDPWGMAEFALDLARFDSSDWVGRLTPPAFVLVLGRDRTIPPQEQISLAETLQAERTQVVRAGHRAPMDQSARADLIAGLLETLSWPLWGGSAA